jgi:L-threonylcarbamoyladenylate synthase
MNNQIKLSDNLELVVEKAIKILNSHGIILIPFDTVYGFICDPSDNIALEKIFRLKKRNKNKTIGLAVSSLFEIEKIAEVPNRAFIEEKIPGKFTFILKSKNTNFSPYCYQTGTVGVRVPDNELVLKIAEHFGPIAQTSANKSGLPNCLSMQEIQAQFSKEELGAIDLIVNGGDIKEGKPSEIWNITEKEPTLIER